MDSRLRGNDGENELDSRLRGNDGENGPDSRLRGSDGGLDSTGMTPDSGLDSAGMLVKSPGSRLYALRSMKILFLTVMPSPYVQDLFAAMAADERIELRVLYLEQEAPDTHWGPQPMPDYARVLPGRWFGFSGARVHWNPTIRAELRADTSDLVVVVGYVGLTNQVAMRYLTRQARPWVFWGEVPGLHNRRAAGRWLRRLAQQPLRHAAGIAAVGTHAVAAYRQLLATAADDCLLRNIPYHCDISAFQQAAARRSSSQTLRLLYCGQLIRRKGVDLLCQAFQSLVSQGADATLTLVGEGPLRSELERSLSPEAAKRVHFLGFQPVDHLPDTFAAADVFVLPSRHDGWGVVVNQALAAGLPIIATTAVGAANDLVEPGENGFCIQPDSAQAIQDAMRHFLNHPDDVASFGARSSQLAESISLSQAVQDWYELFQAALGESFVVCH